MIFQKNEALGKNIFFFKLHRIVELEAAQFFIRKLFGTNSIFEGNMLQQESVIQEI